MHHDARSELRRDTHTLANPAAAEFAVTTLTPEVAYGLSGRASLRLRAPVHWKEFEEGPAGSSVRGLGDLELAGSYDLLGGTAFAGERWDLAASAGLSLPTGKHRAQPFVGEAAPTPLQLGGGTWDPLLAVGVRRHAAGDLALDASASARLALMENSDEYRPPSVFEAAGGAVLRLAGGRASLALHAEWSHLTRVEVAAVQVPNTGRDALYIVPAASLRLNDQLALDFTTRVPLHLRVNETQLAEDALLAARLVYRAGPLFGKEP